MRASSVRGLIANTITVSRVVVALCLLLFPVFSVPWLVLYLWCGVSDVADGILARRLQTTSQLGARLDSLSDFALTVVLAVMVIPAVQWGWWMLFWIVAIAVVRFISMAICRHRFGVFAFLHTYGNKAAGAAAYVAVALIPLCGVAVPVALACAVASASAVEELALMVHMHELNLDRKSLFTGK